MGVPTGYVPLRRAYALLALSAVALTACVGSEAAPGTQTTSTPPPAISPRPSPLIDPDEIIEVLGPDQIPAIDEPKFRPATEARFLTPQEPVLALAIAGDARAYPAQILIWHEIVNDTVGGVPVAVTYCPLCNTAVVFERPVIDGEPLDFGTSGSLYLSNLVMYDRQTNSLWPQATGQAAVGRLTGTSLEIVPAQLVSFGDFRDAYPDGKVLSRQTGTSRDYGLNPYEGYDDPDSRASFFLDEPDPRLPIKARVLGVLVADQAFAVPYKELTAHAVGGWSVLEDRVAGEPVVVFWKSGTVSALDQLEIAASTDVGAMAAFSPRADGRNLTFRATESGIVDDQTGSTWGIFGIAVDGPLAGERLPMLISIESFWFDWAAFYPRTRIAGEDA